MTNEAAGDGAGRGEVEYLDTGAGGPGLSGSRRWGPIAGLAVGGLLIAGAAAWGVTQFLGGGVSPATAVPGDAFGYLAVNLDPGGEQQVAAYRFLKKFPALEDKLHLSGDEDLRRTIVDELLSSSDCKDLDYASDVQPWLGNSLAVAGRMGDKGPEPYVLIGITDKAKAEAGFDKIAACNPTQDSDPPTAETAENPGVAFTDDFMVLADDKAHATKFINDAAESSLADDTDFQARVEAAGGEGFVTGYLAPSAVHAFAKGMRSIDPMSAMESGDASWSTSSASASPVPAGRAPALVRSEDNATPSAVPGTSSGTVPSGLPSDFPTEMLSDLPSDFPTELLTAMPSDMPTSYSTAMPMPMVPMSPFGFGSGTKELEKYFKDFRGAAMSLRFEDGDLTLHVNGAGLPSVGAVEGGASGIGDLPGTTAVAYGVPVSDTFVSDMLKSLGGVIGESTLDQGLDEVQAQTGLDVRTDLQPMLGDGFSIALDSSADLTGLDSGGEQAIQGLPVGIRINGDPDTVAPLLEKLLAALPVPPGMLHVESGDGAVALGPDPDYTSTLADDGDLGSRSGFQEAVPDLDSSGAAVYVDLDGDWLRKAIEADDSAESEQVLANLEPLQGVGLSASTSGDEVDSVLRITTD